MSHENPILKASQEPKITEAPGVTPLASLHGTTREEVYKALHMDTLKWIAGSVNVVAMAPQLWTLLSTGEHRGISLTMISTYLAIQLLYAADGYLRRDKAFFTTLMLSAVMSSLVIGETLYLRSQE